MCTQNSFHKICEECGKPFTAGMATTRYCSERCSKLAYKHKKRDERLAGTTLEVREKQRLALLDKDFLTLTDAARLMQMSRNTLYRLADCIGKTAAIHLSSMKIRGDWSDGDIDYEEGFYILKHTLCPCILTENGFMTNEQECRWLQTDEALEAITMTHVDGIAKYCL